MSFSEFEPAPGLPVAPLNRPCSDGGGRSTSAPDLGPVDRAALQALQWQKLSQMLRLIAAAPKDGFYPSRFAAGAIAPLEIRSLDDFRAAIPLTVKADLLADRLSHPPFGTNLTFPLERYTHFCQTSGTSSGQPLAWLDTDESWEAMLSCWRRFYRAAGLREGRDRILFAFAFGPFLGFWTAFEAASGHYLTLPCGGLSSQARLVMMARYGATVLCGTPTYALRLGEVLTQADPDLRRRIQIEKLIVAGEPGGSIPEVRQRLVDLWGGARVFDHHGMTEVGPISYEEVNHPGRLTIIEEAYLAEVVDPASGHEVADGECGELLLTNLDRTACPLLRYRSGDWVRKRIHNGRLCLEGGILSRLDDMVVIRGVNIYPSAVESIVRQFPEVVEFLVRQHTVSSMDEVELQVEVAPDCPDPAALVRRLETRLRDTFSMRIPVTRAPAQTLPRHEFKAKRWQKL